MFSEKLSEGLAVVGCIDPDAYGTGAVNGDAVDMSKFGRALAIVMAGDLGASATLDHKLQYSADGSTGWTDLTGKAITQMTQAGSDDNKQALIEITAEELERLSAGAGRYIRDVLTVGTATSDAGAVLLAGCARHHPASQDDLASVDEIVS